MCGRKPKQQAQVMPAQAVAAQPVSASASVKSAVKDTDKLRGSDADLRADGVNAGTGVGNTDTNLPTPGEVALGAKKKRKGVVGLDL